MCIQKKLPGTFTKKDVEIITREPLYQGIFSLIRYRFRHRRFDGTMSGEISREIFERGHSVAVLLYDPKRDEVVLIEQLRISAYDNSQSPWLLELVAGIIEEGENTEEVVRREAFEEAGLTPNRLKPLVNCLTSPGGSSERMFIMAGEIDATQAQGIHGLEEENEDILVHVVSREQAWDWVEKGKIDSVPGIIALQWLQLNHLKLRLEWNPE